MDTTIQDQVRVKTLAWSFFIYTQILKGRDTSKQLLSRWQIKLSY